MSKHEGRRLDRHTAEQLLRGAPADTSDALAGLLAAAAAPPRDGELGGEPAAVTAFLEAVRHDRAPRPRSPSMSKSRLRAVKVAAVAAAVFAVGGVAAAATGVLPLPGGGGTPAPAASEHARPPAGSSTAATSAHPSEGTRTAGPATPSPSLTGLCHAYFAGAKTEHGKALESPAFTALITAAGDRTKVDGYCATLLADESPGRGHTTGPGNADNGKDHPAAPHPNGPPGTHPNGPPPGRPTH
ncbi:hypothetical protein [Amycolatopsis kentuckyensis]|uniref:hypothetical protein n=1 Tax=Amycolatopsis kentuckyensis TaxID=218823 RepID=UPI003566C84B